MRFADPLSQTEPVSQDNEVDKNKKLVSVESCPYLGLLTDPAVRYGFPSPANVCFRSRAVSSPAITHQDAYCLSGVHDYCPVFLHEVDQAPSSEANGARGILGLQLSPLALGILLLAFLALVGFFAYQLSPNVRGWFSGLPFRYLWNQAVSAVGTRFGVTPRP